MVHFQEVITNMTVSEIYYRQKPQRSNFQTFYPNLLDK